MVSMFFISSAVAGVFWSEEELQEEAELAIAGTVSESTCISSNVSDDGVETIIYEAVISIDEVLINTQETDFSTGMLTLRSVNTTYPPEQELECSSNDVAHPVGEAGTYYLLESASEGLYVLYAGGFFESEDSNPETAPECPNLEDPSSETQADSSDSEGDEEAKGCASVTASSWVFWLALLGLRRRR